MSDDNKDFPKRVLALDPGTDKLTAGLVTMRDGNPQLYTPIEVSGYKDKAKPLANHQELLQRSFDTPPYEASRNTPDELELMYPVPMKPFEPKLSDYLSEPPAIVRRKLSGMVELHKGSMAGLEKIVGDEALDIRDLNIEDTYPKHRSGYNYLFTTLIDGEPALMVETRWPGEPVCEIERFQVRPDDFTPRPPDILPIEDFFGKVRLITARPCVIYDHLWGSYGQYSKGVQKITVKTRIRTLH
ncbi:hypothetical protein D3C81_304860 [compost metagenome]